METTDGWETTESPTTSSSTTSNTLEPAFHKNRSGKPLAAPYPGDNPSLHSKKSVAAAVAVNDQNGNLAWTGSFVWMLCFSMRTSDPATIGGQPVNKKVDCFDCTVSEVRFTALVMANSNPHDALATRLSQAINEALGMLQHGNTGKDYIDCPDVKNGVTGTSVHDPTYGLQIHTDAPSPERPPTGMQQCRLESH